MDDIVTVGAFTGPGYCLTDATIYQLKSLGYNVELTENAAMVCSTEQDPTGILDLSDDAIIAHLISNDNRNSTDIPNCAWGGQ
jgi:hypothetical protein